MIGRDPSSSNTDWLHAAILWFLYLIEESSTNSSKLIGNFPEVSNLNQFFLQLNWLLVLPVHCLS
jgi:hypothetical protein